MSNLYSFLNKNRKIILVFVDTCIAIFSYLLPFVMSGMYSEIVASFKFTLFLNHFWIYTIILVATFVAMGVYNSMWRYAGIEDMLLCLKSSVIANIIFIVISFIFKLNVRYYVYFVVFPVSTLLTTVVRVVYRALMIVENRNGKSSDDYTNVMIVGAGEATVAILNEIKSNNPKSYRIKCIIDDDQSKIGRTINSINVVGNTNYIIDACRKYSIQEIIFSIPSIDKENKKRILDICSKTKCKLKIIPEVYTLLSNDVKTDLLNKIRDVQVEDLLGRESISLDCTMTKTYIKDKVILVTGGGGSIGSELCRQIASYEPEKLIILDIYENNAYDIQQELLRKYDEFLNFEVQIASVRDINKLDQIFTAENIDIVFHAAAHKHVPLMESNPEEAIKNNVIGTYNVAQIAYKHKVEKFVLISTDKAVNPTNIMGATKRIAEMIIQAFDTMGETDYVAVRFGNVLGSNGSVIPLFVNQIKAGGPVTLTHEEITRYFMTIPEAVQLVLQAGSMAQGGEMFVLDMGEPVRIKDLAYNLIRLSGLEPDVDIDVICTGLRPGEKLYEELLIDTNKDQTKTDINKIFIEKPNAIDEIQLSKSIEALRQASFEMDLYKEIEIVEKLVPSYKCGIKSSVTCR
jgi:FlaA1/EpsC-like NDP-sugar epimerase